ncbi:serine/threonine protein kinase [Streptomyces sp. NBC_01476]|uniref:protein kinase domain-containing protein n=1 Tax=Streptomyces sp. NBC_01476 TaxID=2903881 RepID=UPI002E31EAD5|nr:protein kinase [Streptomyces sp. NBC_01476]
MDASGGSGRPADGGPGDGGTGRWVVPGYTHERELGAGASGSVVLARHDATGTAVAIKYLSAQYGEDQRFRAAFRDEAQLLGGLHSPYIARFYEYVEDGPDAAIVMELVDGIALNTLLRQEGATDPEPALTVLKGSLLGLAAAHAAGVVHRDYKPANVLVGPDGRSKLVDFGVAVRSGESGSVAGTPSYMAPEQWAGGPATPATDVYAATATFFECLTGTKPYAGSTMVELAVQHAEAPIPNDQVPEPVRPLIRRGLAKTPPERPQSAADFVAELQAVATAAYGADWEERGRRKLAALVALLPLLLPYGAGHASATTALAHTELGKAAGGGAGGGGVADGAGSADGAVVVGAAAGAGAAGAMSRGPRFGRRGKVPAGAVVAVLVSAGLAVTAVATAGGGPDDAAGAGVTPSALTTLISGTPVAPATGTPASASPSPTASPSASASGTTSPTATPTTVTPTTTAPGGTATAIPTGGATAPASGGPPATKGSPTTAPPTTTAAPPPPPPPPLDVTSVSIAGFGCGSPGSDAAGGTVTVRSNGSAAVTLTLTWFHSRTPGPSNLVVATASVRVPKGKSFSQAYVHTFGADTTRYWGLTVSTTPAADSGSDTATTAGCVVIT